MKKFLSFFVLLLALAACDSKRDINGPFDGQWQLLSYTGPNATVQPKADQRKLYLGVQLKLLKFWDYTDPTSYYLCYFTRTADSLFIDKIVNYPSDTLCTVEALAPYGIPATRLCVKTLTEETLILSTEQVELTYRKY